VFLKNREGALPRPALAYVRIGTSGHSKTGPMLRNGDLARSDVLDISGAEEMTLPQDLDDLGAERDIEARTIHAVLMNLKYAHTAATPSPMVVAKLSTAPAQLFHVSDALAAIISRRCTPAHCSKSTGRPRKGQSRLWNRREVTAWAKVWRKDKPWR
jgi:hypothetical protein